MTEEKMKYSQAFYQKHQNDKKHCDICGVDVNRFNYNHHTKTGKHIKNLNKKEEETKKDSVSKNRLELLKSMNLDEKMYFIVKQLIE
jgi:hypothetical protein